MITSSVSDLINGSLRLIGQLAEGETPSASTSQDALTALNQMIDSWNIENLSVFTTQDQSFSWPVNQATRTLGPTGDFIGNRPVSVDDSTYYVDSNNISYPVQMLNQDQYNAIAQKNITSTYPQYLWINMDYPNVTLKIYPVPTALMTWHFISITELTQPSTLSDTLAFPPGYLRAFRFNLAIELAAEFGVSASPEIVVIARKSKLNLQQINHPSSLMSMPASLISNTQRYNIFTDNA